MVGLQCGDGEPSSDKKWHTKSSNPDGKRPFSKTRSYCLYLFSKTNYSVNVNFYSWKRDLLSKIQRAMMGGA